jgi:hypothetical protein
LTITMPAWQWRLKCVACFSEVVAMPADRPNSVSLAGGQRLFVVLHADHETTGPKISSRLMRIALVVR